MKTSIDVSRQTRKFYAQANMLLRNFWYFSNEVKCSLFKSFCTNMNCYPLLFNSTSSSVKNWNVVTTVFYVVCYVYACLIVHVQCL